MFFKRNKVEVVTPMNETVYEEEKAKYKYATRKEVALASVVPVAAAVGFGAYQLNKLNEVTTSTVNSTPVNVMANAPEPTIQAFTPLAVTAPSEDLTAIPTGFIADQTLETLATIFDPFIQIIVGISFPVASLMVAIGFFIMMFGMKEKALTIIMNAGIGYVLVQMLPLFNQLLKAIGSAV